MNVHGTAALAMGQALQRQPGILTGALYGFDGSAYQALTIPSDTENIETFILRQAQLLAEMDARIELLGWFTNSEKDTEFHMKLQALTAVPLTCIHVDSRSLKGWMLYNNKWKRAFVNIVADPSAEGLAIADARGNDAPLHNAMSELDALEPRVRARGRPDLLTKLEHLRKRAQAPLLPNELELAMQQEQAVIAQTVAALIVHADEKRVAEFGL